MMGTETTGFVHTKGLWPRIDEAERADNLQIKVRGIRPGERYHIRPFIDYQNGRNRLQAGDYTIKAVDYFHGPTFKTCFQVEGGDEWHRFDEWLIFSYVD